MKKIKRIKDSDMTVGSVFTICNGETFEIKREFKENIDETWVEFYRSGGGYQQGKNETSLKTLRTFLSHWSAIKS